MSLLLLITSGAQTSANTDSSAGSDSGDVLVATVEVDSGAGSDSGIVLVGAIQVDLSAGVDSGAITILAVGSDSGTGTDSGVIVVAAIQTDSSTGSDSAALAISVAGLDSGSGVDSGAAVPTAVHVDSSAGVDTGAVTLAVAGTDSSVGADSGTAAVVSGTITSANVDSSAGTDSGTATVVQGAIPAPPVFPPVSSGGAGGGGGGSRSWASVVLLQDWKDRKKCEETGGTEEECEESTSTAGVPRVSVFYNTTVTPTLIFSSREVSPFPAIIIGAFLGWLIAENGWVGAIVGGLSALVLTKWISGQPREMEQHTVDFRSINSENSPAIPQIVPAKAKKTGNVIRFKKRGN